MKRSEIIIISAENRFIVIDELNFPPVVSFIGWVVERLGAWDSKWKHNKEPRAAQSDLLP
jgi:hypothetical protein